MNLTNLCLFLPLPTYRSTLSETESAKSVLPQQCVLLWGCSGHGVCVQRAGLPQPQDSTPSASMVGAVGTAWWGQGPQSKCHIWKPSASVHWSEAGRWDYLSMRGIILLKYCRSLLFFLVVEKSSSNGLMTSLPCHQREANGVTGANIPYSSTGRPERKRGLYMGMRGLCLFYKRLRDLNTN